MRKPLAVAFAALFIVSAPALAAPVRPPAPDVARNAQSSAAALPIELTGKERSRVLTEASAALDAMRRLSARFTQVAPDGTVSAGALYLERPGKVRFQYDAPNPLTIVADGATVAVADRALRTVDRTPLRATPLYFVLKSNVNLEKDARISQVARQGDLVLITARDRKGETEGAITFTLSAKDYGLRSWRVMDGQGQTTAITLSNANVVAQLDPKLFRLDEKEDPTARRRTR
jgi:outer membrane lipoprotein-sorting protein